MNNHHCVPDFEIEMEDDEYPMPSASGQKKPSVPEPEDGIMELLWQNGQVVMQSQNQRHQRKPPPSDPLIPAGTSTAREIRSSQQQQQQFEQNFQNQLFMQEDEMISWLHYPIVDDPPPLDHNFCADILYPPPQPPAAMQNPHRTTELRQAARSVALRPPIPPQRKPELESEVIPNFAHFSKHNARVEAGPSSSKSVKESTVVDSCNTPAALLASSFRNTVELTERNDAPGTMSAAAASTSVGGDTGFRETTTTCEMMATSSPGGSSGGGEMVRRAAAEDRKRKGREGDESECHSEDVYVESAEAKKQNCGSSSTKRSRAAEVHNLSERRRRDRINEKMRALQELIPRCNKSDKASMLDEAIEYLKSLQLQVQMMSMGCGMVPMMFPGIQQYMPPMGMGMGMGMGIDRPLMPFPNMLAASAMPQATVAQLGPRFPMPPFQMLHAPQPDSSRMQAAAPNQPENNTLPPFVSPDPNQLRIPNFSDPYQQGLGPHQQMHLQFLQNQVMNNPTVSKPSISKNHENEENNQPGQPG